MAFNRSDNGISSERRASDSHNKASGKTYKHGQDEANQDAFNGVFTAGSINMPPELFEKLYMAPKNEVKGELRGTFGNPTPLALAGFILSLTPLSCDLMGWREAGGSGAASIGVYFFVGGLLMLLGSVGEWILGNTFPFVVFGTFGGFWCAFGATLVPWFNAYGAYADPAQASTATANSGNPLGLHSPAFNSSFAFFLLFMAVISVIFLVCSLRTNIVFVTIFLSFVLGFSCVAGAYWKLALAYGSPANAGAATAATNLLRASGGCFFVASLAGWWVFCAIMLAALDFPFQIPVGDLSRFIKARSERGAAISAA